MPHLADDRTTCCGCAACAAVCPVNAVSMQSDGVFDYPVVDETICVDCKKCERVCAFKQAKPDGRRPLAAFAATHTDDVRLGSSSGGIFTALTDHFLRQGGAVYGAAYDHAMRVTHSRADDEAGRDRMRGSKYVQSDMGGIYGALRRDLDAGRPVLFSGTPCEVATVKAFFGADAKRIFLVDIICHGVPSPAFWQDFIRLLEAKYGKKVTDYRFRNKEIAWRRYSPLVTLADGTTVPENDLTGSFIEMFRYELTLRPSCAVCPYASLSRQGDLTIGDFWGVEKRRPALDDDKGVSAVLVNTETGRAVLDALRNDVTLTEVTADDIAAGQANLSRPSVRSPEADTFIRIWKEKGAEAALKEYTRVGAKRRLKDAAKAILRR